MSSDTPDIDALLYIDPTPKALGLSDKIDQMIKDEVQAAVSEHQHERYRPHPPHVEEVYLFVHAKHITIFCCFVLGIFAGD